MSSIPLVYLATYEEKVKSLNDKNKDKLAKKFNHPERDAGKVMPSIVKEVLADRVDSD